VVPQANKSLMLTTHQVRVDVIRRCNNCARRREIEAKTRSILMGGEVDINSLVEVDEDDVVDENALDFDRLDDALAEEEEGKLVAA